MKEVAQTTPSHLSGNSTTKNHADGSFEKILKDAEKKLITPWAQIEKLFNISKLEFDFNFSSAKIEKDPSKQKEHYISCQKETTPKSKENIKAIEEVSHEIKNTKVLKEVLAKHVPTSHIPPPTSGFFFNIGFDAQQMISKSDLQSVINEIVKNAKLVKSGQKTELSLTLSQKELGEMFITLVMKNGQVLINIAANPQAKTILEKSMDELELALKESHINLNSIKITEVNHGKSQHFSG